MWGDRNFNSCICNILNRGRIRFPWHLNATAITIISPLTEYVQKHFYYVLGSSITSDNVCSLSGNTTLAPYVHLHAASHTYILNILLCASTLNTLKRTVDSSQFNMVINSLTVQSLMASFPVALTAP